MPTLPRKHYDWPADAVELAPERMIELYIHGAAGAVHNPEQDAAAVHEMQWKSFSDAAHEFGLAGTGEGKLSTPFLSATKVYPEAWHQPAQTTGDCVSRGTANGCTVTVFVEIDLALPDEVTGRVEGPPVIAILDGSQGVFATEPIYGDRGHSGQGASCAQLARHVTEWGGLMPRVDYPELGVDLSRYNSRIGANWGGRGTPGNVQAEGKKHQIRHSTKIKSVEEARDALANGYGLDCCSGYGFSSKRNEDGVAKRSGSWSHAMCWSACDDRAETKRKYGGMLFLIQNSWGTWNSGPRKIMGTNLMIPKGSFWVVERDARGIINSNGSFAFSAANGWPRKNLPDYGSHVFG